MKLRYLLAAPILVCVAFLSFNVSAAVDQATNDTTSWLDLARPVYDAFAGHHPALGICLALVLFVALIKRYAGNTSTFGAFIHGDAGGSLLVLVGSAATAAASTLGNPGASISLDLLKQALIVGVGAAGGYAMIKSLLIEPILKPLAARAPAWAQPLFSVVFWVFDHPPGKDPAVVQATAITAGQAAVEAKPATGANGIVGAATQVK